ncbi:AAA family ATPase [Corynebacterium stationis]|uniref:AAA family ATPase n=1 Tax=Corynebacterium stationis TaxID=1705 RepID=UPI0028A9A073|nr:AAA family ATPase [Corynebacterium stationis]
MKNEALIAVAGAGKTESIVQRFAKSEKKTLFITYTSTGQEELKSRLTTADPRAGHEVIGWYGFLIEHFLKPFIPDYLGPGERYAGFSRDYRPERWHKMHRRHFDSEGRVGGQSVAFVSREICDANGKQPISRLELIYDQIIIDEVQDLAANDLVILEYLLESSISLFMVGDMRQTVFETSTSDRKYPQFRKASKIGWFELMRDKGRLELKFDSVNRRCHEDIVRVSNFVFSPDYNFPEATSEHSDSGVGFGLHHVAPNQVLKYCEQFKPLVLRWSKASEKSWAKYLDFDTFGNVKGRTVEHVLIFPTDAMKDFLASGAPIKKDEPAAKFYVGITRARHSVGFVLPKSFGFADSLDPSSFKLWTTD